jgi:CHASE2 domain-containing sensor protein
MYEEMWKMDTKKKQLTFGIVLLSAFLLIYVADLSLSLRTAFCQGNWFPFCFILVLSLIATLRWGYLYLQNLEEQKRRKPPTTEA